MSPQHTGWTDALFKQAFGRVLRELRREREWSQEALADASGYHVNHIGFLERGIRSPTLIAVFQLAAALDISPLEVVRRVQQEVELLGTGS